jgi:Protein of unknown function (DUF1302)
MNTEGAYPMRHHTTIKREPSAKQRLLAATILAGGAFAGWLTPTPAAALPVNLLDGQITGNFDTTISMGASVRVQDRDRDLIAIGNGGTLGSWNTDNGNLNYDNGDLTSAAAKALHELDLKWRNFGLFGRFVYFYDPVIMDTSTDRTKLPDAAETISGRDIDLLDLYASANFEILGRPTTVKIGNQVLNWGESTFIGNGINVINPVDVGKLRVAGSEIKEALLPIPAVDVRFALSKRVSIEGFYQVLFVNTEGEPAGTFFSANDFASPGGKHVFLGFGRLPTNDNPPTGAFAPRALDERPSDTGQFGFAMRYFEPALNDSEFGLYYVRHHSRLPLLSARTGQLAPVLAGLGAAGYAQTAQYFREFPEKIDLFGASFNTTIESFGLSLYGEASYRNKQPLQIDDVELLFATLSPLDAVAGTIFGANNQIGRFGFGGQEITGYRRKDVLQAQVSALKAFGPNFGASQISIIGEVGGTFIRDMEDKSVLRYEGPGTASTGNPACVTGLGAGAAACGAAPYLQADGFPDPFSWGYRLVASAQYNNVIGPVGLTPSLAFAHDVAGTTPSPLGNFVEGRKSVTAALRASYQNNWRADLSYANFFGGGTGLNQINDRDFVSLSFSYSF